MDDLLNAMTRARLSWVSPRLAEWYDGARLARQVAGGLSVDAARVGDVAFGAEFRDAVGIGASADPLDWANRRIDLATGGWVVAGIRFRGLDVTRPFVDVVATNEAASVDGLAAVAADVVPAFAPFRPRCLRVEVADPAGCVERLATDGRFDGGSVDQYLVAGVVDDLRARRRAPSYELVALRPGDPAELAQRAAAIYAELGRLDPQLREWAQPEDADSLADCAAEGLLFEVVASGRPVGVVAAVRDDAHGMSGFCVEEICLDPGRRGGGLAAGVLQRLLDHLPAGEGDVLWGSIHPDNARSLRTSLSVGREVVGGYVWVTPAGLPGMPTQT